MRATGECVSCGKSLPPTQLLRHQMQHVREGDSRAVAWFEGWSQEPVEVVLARLNGGNISARERGDYKSRENSRERLTHRARGARRHVHGRKRTRGHA